MFIPSIPQEAGIAPFLLDRRSPGPEVKLGHNVDQWAVGLESKPPDSAGSP